MVRKKIIPFVCGLLSFGYFASVALSPALAGPQKKKKRPKIEMKQQHGKKERTKPVASRAVPVSLPSQVTLKEILEYVYQYHPRLQASRAETRANDEIVIKAKAAWLPKLSASGTRDVSKTRTNLGRDYISPNNSSSIKLTQQLFDLGATNAHIDSARKTVLANEASYAHTEQEVLLNAIKAYVSIIRDTKGLEIARDQEKILAENYKYDKAKFDVGEMTKADLDLTRARLEGAIAAVTSAEGDLEKSRAAFLEAVGLAPSAPLVLPGTMPHIPPSLEEVKSVALKENPSLLNALYTLDAARLAADAAYGSLQPSGNLQLSGTRSVRSRGPSMGTSNVGELMATVNVPLYQTENFADIRQKQESVIAKKLSLNYAYFSTTQQAMTAWTNLVTGQAKIKQLEAQVTATAESVARYREEERAGAGDIFRRLQVEQDLYNYRQQLNQVQADVLTNEYMILSIMGRLTPQVLGLDVTVYNPRDNYRKVKNAAFGFKTTEMEEIFPEQKASLEIPPEIQRELDLASSPLKSLSSENKRVPFSPEIKKDIQKASPLLMNQALEKMKEEEDISVNMALNPPVVTSLGSSSPSLGEEESSLAVPFPDPVEEKLSAPMREEAGAPPSEN